MGSFCTLIRGVKNPVSIAKTNNREIKLLNLFFTFQTPFQKKIGCTA